MEIPPEKVARIERFVQNIIQEKEKETEYKNDCHKKYKRFYTGTLGEAAIEELLGLDIIDWEIGHSAKFAEADLRTIGLNVGVKTVEYGSFPVIHKRAKRPEIINVKLSDNQVLVCGFAFRSILDCYQDIELIKSPALRQKGTKTGFYGFDKLVPISTLNSLTLLQKLDKLKST